MCMWSSTTCASHAALHVHVKQRCAPGNRADALNNVKQDYTPGKETFLSKKSKIQHRTTACFPHKEMHQAMVDEWKYR